MVRLGSLGRWRLVPRSPILAVGSKTVRVSINRLDLFLRLPPLHLGSRPPRLPFGRAILIPPTSRSLHRGLEVQGPRITFEAGVKLGRLAWIVTGHMLPATTEIAGDRVAIILFVLTDTSDGGIIGHWLILSRSKGIILHIIDDEIALSAAVSTGLVIVKDR